MEEVKNPSAVHEGILSEIARVRREERRKAASPHTRRVHAAFSPRRWRLVAVAACSLALAVALIPLSGQLWGVLDRQGGKGSSQSFSVRAYASATRTLVPPTEDGMIVFERSGSLTTAEKDWYLQYGKYTGCMFTVEGEGIVRIQATTSAGMLYRNSYETINGRNDPERVAEVSLWKPTKAGLGEYYGLYENVQIVDGFGEPDPDRDMTVKLTKMLGSTIDVPISAEDGSDAKSFGLWTNAAYDEVDETKDGPLAATDAVFDTFDGETITVTAYFEDGSCATQTIELHTADFKATLDDPLAFYGYGTITVHPEIVDRSTLPDVFGSEVNEGAPFALHSLYGIIVDETDEPHPYPLDQANEWLNDTVPFVFERRDTWETAGEARLDTDAISDPDGKATLWVPVDSTTVAEDGETFPLEMANLHIERSDRLPFGMTPEDTSEYGGYRGDLAYANRVSEQILGYRMDDDGALTPGFSYRVVTFTATNASAIEVSLHTAGLGSFAVLESEEGDFSTLATRAVWETGYDGATNSGGGCTLAPGETQELTVVYVVPDELDEQYDPLFVFDVYGGKAAAFRIKSLL